ncbi:MAG: tRNA (adenosine(37)-N6)-dimethylallyltransferase MiaA [Bdellovibrionales bacterium RIFCSPHIGHO2_01_FULL_40_29]|nr:MAG: tRNA (adenosine(37)-N6)-dimethylallyltransferase MiaA [Bdellovibrionales bacterium RIFCSPHIGHO2_01_FULL_40_29]OFZ34553.1 MAG: tRNA (adenosine(37)-N6)-dimethylallyltransferase MiaA [Bdellovibrionales bacterium RIFCSPHIGHO2_02_FULL_40_15]
MVVSTKDKKKFIFVVGSTASGKSSWALNQAQRLGGSIVNIDSVQFYKGLEVGSAAPTLDEMNLVPHYLYSFVEAPHEMTAGVFLRRFYELIEKGTLRFPVFVVGGTGFYIQALEKGMYDLEPASLEYRQEIERELKEHGPEMLHAELTAADPEHIIHVNDHYRLVRAIEILRQSGETPAQLKAKSQMQQNKNAFPFSYLKVGFSLPKEQARHRVETRTVQMIENGIIEETESFLKRGFQEWAPLSSVGYKDVVDFLIHNKSKQELVSNIVTSTMQLIKKQKTWFKRDSSILWSDLSNEKLLEMQRRLDLFLTDIDPATRAK